MDQVRSLPRGGRGDPDAWRLVPRRPPLPRGYLAASGAAVGACVVLPYGEELPRCARAALRRRRGRSGRAPERPDRAAGRWGVRETAGPARDGGPDGTGGRPPRWTRTRFHLRSIRT
ncbi:hypothetical protein RKE29_14890 [Streptomyces sp. B1866]|uniref:hypothetical protein n=1 Tax=Streptomyces sp. B1866 TaxID=3075431 RepID=UPI00288FE1DF|nr:hypothetical protein [Streptomyces sp. B1866]MDT3397915.1 hypothetical protein [Streptomyces sp. B1866]